MSKKKKLLVSWLLFTALALFPSASVLAAREEPQDVRQEDAGPSSGLEAREKRPPDPADFKKLYPGVFEQSFTADYRLNGLYDGCTGYFNIGEWDVKRAVFIMEYTASQLIDRRKSYFTVSVNQTPVQTMTLEEAGEGAVAVELPVEKLNPGETNALTVQVYLSGKDGDACADDSSYGSWMNIFRESRVMTGYEAANRADTIASFYRKFTSIEALDERQSAVIVREGAPEAVLTAMAGIVSGVSRNAVLYYPNIRCEQIQKEEELSSVPYSIYLCEYDRLGTAIKNRMTPQQKALAEKGAAACLLTDQEGAVMLLLTGKEEACLENAGALFSNAEYVRQLQTDCCEIEAGDGYLMDAYSAPEYMRLADNGVLLNGVFRQEASFTVDYPANRRLAASSQLALDFRYSTNLDFTKSLLTVYVNDVPAGSRRLTRQEADSSSVTFMLPQDIELKGSFTVRIVFDLIPEGEWCNLTPEETPWGYIADTSMLKLTFTENEDLSFSSFPSPFVSDGRMNQALILLPEKPLKEDIGTMGALLLSMGRYCKDNTGSLRVKKGDAPEELTDSNLISIGRAADNALLQSCSAALPFAYDGAGRLTKGPVSVDVSFASKSGTAQLIESPYSETFHAALFISGCDEKGLKYPMVFLGNTDALWKITGNAFLTDGGSLYESHDRQIRETEAPVSETAPPAQGRPFVLVAVSVLLLAVLAGVMLLIRYRKGKEEADE